MKKILSIALSLLLVLTLAACGSNSGASGTSTDASTTSGAGVASTLESQSGMANSELTNITVVFYTGGDVPRDLQLIEDAINEISMKKINTKVKFLPISAGQWNQQTNLMLSSGEDMDLFSVRFANFSDVISKGQLLPIDDLIKEYGQGILEVIDEEYLRAGTVNNELYAVTSIRDLATGYSFTIREDYVDKYSIDLSQVKTFADIGTVLKTIKEAEPETTPLINMSSIVTAVDLGVANDTLGDGFGQLLNMGQDFKVVNWYAEPRYAEMLGTMREWFNAGYMPLDISTNKESRASLIKAGRGVCYIGKSKPGFEGQESRNNGTNMVTAQLYQPYTTTSQVQTIQWCLPINCKQPEKAMQFLNLMYTDADLVNLFDWGIEGKHYQLQDDGTINFPDGVDASSSGYNVNLGWVFGNQFLSQVWNGDAPDLWKQMDQFNDSAIRSKALGFAFDSASVKSDLAALATVTDQYKVALETGSLDPEKTLPEFLQKLETAGIQKVVDEKQRQLDTWSAAQ